jgi:uncharacterized DUF497 family protein
MPEFEWDEAKRRSNTEKHDLDFIDAWELFEGNHFTATARQGRGGEIRHRATGIMQGRYATAIFTLRGDAVRLISLRRARDDERRQHQALFGG